MAVLSVVVVVCFGVFDVLVDEGEVPEVVATGAGDTAPFEA